MLRRVVITGIGAITPIGHGAAGLWKGVSEGRSAVRRLTRFDPSEFRSQNAAQIEDFDPRDYMEQRTVRKLDRFAQLGVAASRQAMLDAGISLDRQDRSRVGVSMGSALGGLSYAEGQHVRYMNGGIRSVDTMLAVAVYGGASGANVAIDLDVRGPNLANANSCASGAMAIGEAFRIIRRGEADVMLAGGVEAPLAPLVFGSFSLIKAMSARNDHPTCASRPFDVARDGFVMGEGAAVLILEEGEAAEKRGAQVYAELVGYGQTNDAYHMTAPRPDGSEAARAVRLALDDAAVSVSDLGYVNAHATGTRLGDMAEARALRSALGENGARVPVSGTKGLYGHALGASGAIEAGITAMALRCGFLPGTANLSAVDDECRLNVLPPSGRREEIDFALSTSFGFGGSNAALLFARPTIA
ncbi:MAG TPA: beta-ketoacyl-[acyl-carrier-protein] synthase II [Chloroflexi bacterium]|jgi:3-oxoacyl-[acyl-carrier-protein] synthase II|nr:beta-ketoacyl-[acyl-carrier-protein] synthase II [Chloroflexota bacterium]